MPLGGGSVVPGQHLELRSRASAISSRESTRSRAAASSMASGRPSSWRQIRATSGALSSVSSKPGSAVPARSHHSWAAGGRRDLGEGRRPAIRQHASGCTGQTRSPGTPSGSRVVTSTRNPRQPSSSWCTASALAPARCSQLSSTSSPTPEPTCAAADSSSGRSASSRPPIAAATSRGTLSGSVTVDRSTHQTPAGYAARNEADHGEGEPGLSRSSVPVKEVSRPRARAPPPRRPPARGRPGWSAAPEPSRWPARRTGAGAARCRSRRRGTAPDRRRPSGRLGQAGRQRGVLAQDLQLQLAQPGARVDAELVVELVAYGLEGLQGLGLAAGPVQRQHQGGVQTLPQGMLPDQAAASAAAAPASPLASIASSRSC